MKTNTIMRAMLVVSSVIANDTFSQSVIMHPVCGGKPFGPEGESEENTFARYTPGGELRLDISNPALFGKIVEGKKFYADFTEVPASGIHGAGIEVALTPIEEEIIADKEMRRDADAIIQRIKSLPATAERTLAMRRLQEGVMWLGMDLKRINDASPTPAPGPYPNSKDPSNTKIEPTADGLKM